MGILRSRNNYVCPFCFNDVNLAKIHYACTNPLCTKTFLDSVDGKRFRSEFKEGEEVDIENSVFLGKDPKASDAVTTKNHIVRGSANGCCDICGRAAYTRLCPICHNPIPAGAEENGSNIFVVLGSEGVGKSHYIAVLINQLRTMFSTEFGTTFTPATDRTTIRYNDSYYRRLFEEGRKLAPTTSYSEDRDSREPMVYYMKFPGEKSQEYTLAFFDTSGKDLDSDDKTVVLSLGSFISKASGIVLLVDPLQIHYVNKRIRMDNKPFEVTDIRDRLAYITEIVRTGNKLKRKDRIDIPLAVVLTKTDVLMKSPENDEEERILFGPESSIHVEREKGKFDRVCFDEISVEVEEYLRRTVGQEFINDVGQYSRHEYFAVSALGNNPSGSVLTKEINPFRVEDPFIWLFNTCSGNGSMRQ